MKIKKIYGEIQDSVLTGVWTDLYFTNKDAGIKNLKLKTFVTIYKYDRQLI